jgi:TPR repeat protein
MARFEIGGAEMAPMGQAAVNGDSFFELGLTFATGRDVETDLVAAHKWFNLAAMKGNQEAARYRQEIALEMSGTQVAEAQRAAREWLRTH